MSSLSNAETKKSELAPAPKYDGYPVESARLPACVIDEGNYRVRFARDAGELDRLLQLRFEVFNLELGEGLAASFETGRDEDEFDAVVHHLIVEERSSGRIVGTYRIQTSEMAAAHRGFYSATEYDIAGIPAAVVAQSVETGRACIAKEFRNRQVLFMLCRGLAEYVATNQKRYVFGCCSITSQDLGIGTRAAQQLGAEGSTHRSIRVEARDEFSCAGAVPAEARVDIPILFRTYLRHGAKVISAPAIDRRFKTIDFLVLLDIREMAARSFELYFGNRGDLIP